MDDKDIKEFRSILMQHAGYIVNCIQEYNPDYYDRVKDMDVNLDEVLMHMNNAFYEVHNELQKAREDVTRWQEICEEVSEMNIKLEDKLKGDNTCH